MTQLEAVEAVKKIAGNEYFNLDETFYSGNTDNGNKGYSVSVFIGNGICIVSGKKKTWEDAIAAVRIETAERKVINLELEIKRLNESLDIAKMLV